MDVYFLGRFGCLEDNRENFHYLLYPFSIFFIFSTFCIELSIIVVIIGVIIGVSLFILPVLCKMCEYLCCNPQSKTKEGNPNEFRRTLNPLVSPFTSAVNYQTFNETARTHIHNDKDKSGAIASTDHDAKKM